MMNTTKRYSGPDEFEHVASFVWTWKAAEELAALYNRDGYRSHKFVKGTFRAESIPGRMPAVVADLHSREAR